MSDMPQAGTISDVLRKVDQDIAEGKPIQEVAVNPAPSPMDVHRERLMSIIDNACANALEQERINVERHTALMRAVQSRRDRVAEVVEDYLRLVHELTQCNVIVRDAVLEFEEKFSLQVIDPKTNGKQS